MVSVQVEVVEDNNGESLDDIEQARVAEGFKLDYWMGADGAKMSGLTDTPS